MAEIASRNAAAEPLGGDVEQPVPALADAAQPRGLVRVERRVDQVAWAATSGGSLSTWSFISAISG